MSKETGNSKKEQIRLSFKSNKISDVTMPSKEDLIDVLGAENVVSGRIYNIRHGMSEEEEQWIKDGCKGDLLQTTDTKLCETTKKEILKLAEQLKRYGINAKNSYFFHNSKRVERVKETARQINEVFKFKKELTQNDIAGLETTDKEEKNKARRDLATADITSEFTIELMELLKNSSNMNVVNIIHKSNISTIEDTLYDQAVVIDSRGIQPLGIREFDMGESKEIIKYKDKKNILFLNSGNIDGILEILRDDEALGKHIKDFDDGQIQIFELQNIINYFFKIKPELCKKHLISENSDLKIFCLANLMLRGYYESIKDKITSAIQNIDNASLEIDLKAIFDLFIEPRYYRQCAKGGRIPVGYLDLFFGIVYANENIPDRLKVYFKEERTGNQDVLARIDFHENTMKNYKYNIQAKTGEIRNKSLDERYHTIDDKGNKRKNIKGIANNFDLGDENIEKNCLDILENNQVISLEGDGGTGKSFFSVYLQEQLKKNHFMHKGKSYSPVFIQLSGKKWKDVIVEIEQQEEYFKNKKYDDSQIVYFFESLDESEFCNESGIEKLLEYVQEGNLKSIISSRVGYLDHKSIGNIKKYTIKGMKDPMIYVRDYFGGNQADIDKYKEFQEQIGEEDINRNSLFVAILCELIRGGGENLKNIDSKWELFAAMAEQRLSKWEGIKREGMADGELSDEQKENGKKEEIRNRLSALEEIAYRKNETNNKITREDIQESMKHCKNSNAQALSFLFKKNDDGEYGFIHQSFENYFLLRYYKERPQELQEIIGNSKEKNRNKNFKLLIISAQEGHKEMVEFLVNKGYNVNEKANDGRNAFMLACFSGELEVAQWLSDKIENINTPDNEGRNAFMWACDNGKLEVAQWLSDRIENINTTNNEGRNAFMLACFSGELEVAQWLSDKIENINTPDNDGRNAFMLACFSGGLEVVQWLSGKIENINTPDNYGINAFMSACFSGELEVAQWLSDKIENINTPDNDCRDAFMLACKNGKLEIVGRLIDIMKFDLDDLKKYLLIAKAAKHIKIMGIIQKRIDEMGG